MEHKVHMENKHHFMKWNEPIFDCMHTDMDIQNSQPKRKEISYRICNGNFWQRGRESGMI